MSQPENENTKADEKPESQSSEPPVESAVSETRATSDPGTGMSSDPRFSRLMKMQSSYVTEEAIRSTEEQAKPKEPEKTESDEEYDEEDYDDEEYLDDDEFEDDFEDDDYEEPPQGELAVADPPPAPEEEEEEVPSEDADHRVAQLRKLRQQFVSDKDLEIKALPTGQEVYRETEIAKVVCPNCQSEEPRTDKICSNCGAKLPNLTAVEEERYNPGTMNVAVLKYVNAVKKLKDGAWSVDEFEDFLHEREQLSQSHIDGLIELVEESGAAEWLPDATKFLLDSTGMLEDAIANMIMKIENLRDQQPNLEAEFEAQRAEFESLLRDGKVKKSDAPRPPIPLDQRVRELNFDPDLDEINRSNELLLNTLKLIDKFQKEGDDDIEVSL